MACICGTVDIPQSDPQRAKQIEPQGVGSVGARALTDVVGERPLRFWINDGLMTIFFLVVGLEIRHEMRHGALSDPRIA